MQKRINLLGFISAALVFSSIVMKVNHFPGGGMAIVAGSLAFSIYLPFLLLSGPGKPLSIARRRAGIVGAVSGSFVNAGITLKILHMPGAGVMLVTGLVSFALFFMPMILMAKMREENTDRSAFMNACGAMGLTLFALGLLFKIQHWPGAAIMLSLSPLLLFGGYFLLYMLDKSIDPETKTRYLKKAFSIIFIGCFIATLIMLDLHRPLPPSAPQQEVAAK